MLPTIDREYGFYEIAIVTRAGQAKILGLKQKGHLGVGADADVAVYNINPELVDPSRKYKKVRKAFKKAAYTIKDGKVVVKDGQIVKPVYGKTFWLDVKTSLPMEINDDLKQKFREYWTIEYENYAIPESFLHVSSPISIKAEV